jgi:hypothetical protein
MDAGRERNRGPAVSERESGADEAAPTTSAGDAEALRRYAALIGLEAGIDDPAEWMPETIQLLGELRRLGAEDLGRQEMPGEHPAEG